MKLLHYEQNYKTQLITLIAKNRIALAELKKREKQLDLDTAREELNYYLNKNFPIFIAVNENQDLIGFTLCRVDEDIVWDELLFVIPEERRKGVGSALFKRAEEFAIALKRKYQIDLTNIKTVNFDFSNTYNKRKPTFITDKFFKNYQSKEAVSIIILTNNKLYDKDLAKEYIDSFDPVLGRMDPSLYPEHIIIITMDEFTSFFGISGSPSQSLLVFRKLKDQALSHNPKVSDEAFEALFQLYTKAKLTLSLIKTDPANVINILRTKQLDLTKFLGKP